jgi:hypothetical protein
LSPVPSSFLYGEAVMIVIKLALEYLISLKTCSEIAGSNCHFVRSD